MLLTQVVEPWKNLVHALAVRTIIDPVPNGPPILTASAASSRDNHATADVATDLSNLLVASREQIQTVSWYILLDFANYLQQYLPEVWAAVTDPGQAVGLSSAEPGPLQLADEPGHRQ